MRSTDRKRPSLISRMLLGELTPSPADSEVSAGLFPSLWSDFSETSRKMVVRLTLWKLIVHMRNLIPASLCMQCSFRLYRPTESWSSPHIQSCQSSLRPAIIMSHNDSVTWNSALMSDRRPQPCSCGLPWQFPSRSQAFPDPQVCPVIVQIQPFLCSDQTHSRRTLSTPVLYAS